MSSGQKVVLIIIAVLAVYLGKEFYKDWVRWNTAYACEFLRMPGSVFHTTLNYVEDDRTLLLVWEPSNPARRFMFNRDGLKACWSIEDG